jgi:hypothetical protein
MDQEVITPKALANGYAGGEYSGLELETQGCCKPWAKISQRLQRTSLQRSPHSGSNSKKE